MAINELALGGSMIIYEVNLTIDGSIYPQFSVWLKKHVKDILEVPGFVQASILKPENEPINSKEKLTVHYPMGT